MRKALAVLLAALAALLPLVGIAGGVHQTDVTFRADEDGMQWLTTILGMEDAEAADTAKLLTLLAEAVSVQVTSREDACEIALRMGESVFLTVSAQQEDAEHMLVRSSLFEGAVLRVTTDASLAITEDDLMEMLVPVAGEWMQGIDVKQENVTVIGDAYAAGTSRMVLRFDDAQVCELVDRLGEAMNLAFEQRKALREAGKGDDYRYELSIVSDAERYTGVSLTVLDSQDQTMATLSLRLPQQEEDGYSLVMGYGRDGHTYYDEYLLRSFTQALISYVSVELNEFCDDAALGYQSVSRMPEYLLLTAHAAIGTMADGAGNTEFKASGALLPTGRGGIALSGSGIYASDAGTLDADGALYAGLLTGTEAYELGLQNEDAPAVTPALIWTITTKPVEALTLAQSDELVIDASDALNSKVFLDKLQQGFNIMTVRILRGMPSELLQLMLMQP